MVMMEVIEVMLHYDHDEQHELEVLYWIPEHYDILFLDEIEEHDLLDPHDDLLEFLENLLAHLIVRIIELIDENDEIHLFRHSDEIEGYDEFLLDENFIIQYSL